MASKKEEQELKRISGSISSLGKTYNDLMNDLSQNTTGSNNDRRKELDQITKEVDKIISGELESLTQYTGADVSTFLIKLFNDQDTVSSNGPGRVKNMEDIFRADDNTLINYFLNKQKEKRALYSELDMIASQLYELKEAILVIRDSIITSDDISKTVSRTLSFDGRTDKEIDNSSAIKQVESLEKKFALHKKMKNFIIPNTLRYGEYYVYTIPYDALFKKYSDMKANRRLGVTESNTVSSILKEKNKNKENYNPVQEMASVISSDITSTAKKDTKGRAVGAIPSSTEISKITESYLNNIEIYNEDVPIPVLEGEALDELGEFKAMSSKAILAAEKRSKVVKGGVVADGVKDAKTDDFNFVGKNVYIKLIDPTKIIPIQVMDEVIGYYYIYDSSGQVLQPFSNSIKLVDSTMMMNYTEDNFIGQLSSKVVQAFDKPFLEKNQKFKDVILNCLMYDEMYRKRLKFQFIPVDYITCFKVNEDEDGNGQSVLKDSLFYAKLYLSLLIFKIIQILTKSSDTRIYYVRNSGLDADIMNGVMSAARQVKEKQINYYDVMNPVTSTSKLGNNNEIFIPYGRSQEKGMEFDILSGQDIQLNSDLMEMLKQGYINATSVPSVIMQYINEADYAKTLVMANSKFVGRAISLQSDFNVPLTDWYKKLLRFCTDIDPDIIDSFEFTFVPPKSVNTQNLNELTAATDQVVQYMLQSYMGQNSDMGELGNRIKDKLLRSLSEYFLPSLPWADLKHMAEMAMLDIKEEDEKKKAATTDENADDPVVPSL